MPSHVECYLGVILEIVWYNPALVVQLKIENIETDIKDTQKTTDIKQRIWMPERHKPIFSIFAFIGQTKDQKNDGYLLSLKGWCKPGTDIWNIKKYP